MSSLLSFINSTSAVKSYQLISEKLKKNDDFGKDAVTTWISLHPASKDMATWETKKINNYVIQLFRDLPASHICETNQVEVKDHIIKIASCCERAHRAVFKEWEKIKLDDTFKKSIGLSLVFCTPRLT